MFDGVLQPVPLVFVSVWLLLLSPLYVVLALRCQTHEARSRRATLVAALVVLLSYMPGRGYNELSAILWSTVLDLRSAQAEALPPGQYPLVRTEREQATKEAKRVPVLLLMVESFNARFLGQTRNGKPVLPVLERYLKEGLHVPRFYGNSVQTSRG